MAPSTVTRAAMSAAKKNGIKRKRDAEEEVGVEGEEWEDEMESEVEEEEEEDEDEEEGEQEEEEVVEKGKKDKGKAKEVSSGANLKDGTTGAGAGAGGRLKSKVLLLSSRGITQRMRHLMGDLHTLLPHSKKDAKLDTRHDLPVLNELCDLSSCNSALFFECRRHRDLYLWASKAPNGPSVRFHVLNMHTMDELKMTGNCLKGSRPIVVFDKEFETEERWLVIKEVLNQIFAVPKTSRKAKPFVDHVISFSIADGKIWFRNYQIVDNPPPSQDPATTSTTPDEATKSKKKEKGEQGSKLELSEIGPRFVLNPIKIFEGSFGGAKVYENQEFVPPTLLASTNLQAKAAKFRGRKDSERERQVRLGVMERDKKEDALEKRKVFA